MDDFRIIEVGDVVRLVGGTSKLRVTSIYPYASKDYNNKYDYIYCRYIGSNRKLHRRRFEFVLVRKDKDIAKNLNDDNGDDEMTNRLYEITRDQYAKTYGHKIGVNSNNQWIMEERGTGKIIVIDEHYKVEEVLPYTVTVNSQNSKKSVIVKPGSVVVGDMLILVDKDNKFVVGFVSELDTKVRDPESFKIVRKFLAETILVNE